MSNREGGTLTPGIYEFTDGYEGQKAQLKVGYNQEAQIVHIVVTTTTTVIDSGSVAAGQQIAGKTVFDFIVGQETVTLFFTDETHWILNRPVGDADSQT